MYQIFEIILGQKETLEYCPKTSGVESGGGEAYARTLEICRLCVCAGPQDWSVPVGIRQKSLSLKMGASRGRITSWMYCTKKLVEQLVPRT